MVQNNRCGNGVGSTKGKKQRGKGAKGKHATNKKVGEREQRVVWRNRSLAQFLSLWSC